MYQSQVGCQGRFLCTRGKGSRERAGPNDVLLKINCTGLCMSDIHFMVRANDLDFPDLWIVS